ncbi:beta-L-arabinofuranosidase domain-containing protein [Bacteroidota bacterium]
MKKIYQKNFTSLNWIIVVLIICVFSGGCNSNTEEVPNDYPIQQVPFTQVKVTDNFWAPRILMNHKVTIPIALQKSEETGRIENFSRAGGITEGPFCSIYPFDDSDIYKILEGASYSIQTFPDTDMEEYMDSLIYLIGMAQEEDGYLYTSRTINPDSVHEWGKGGRWLRTHELSHELYNMGHLYEAAVAHYIATGKRTLLDIAIKSADLIDKDFGPGKLELVPGHQVIEMGLAKLYRVTGEDRYIKLAKFFLDKRGPDGPEYSQVHKKVVDQDEAVGHAVRANYMYAGMADIAALTGDADYIAAIDKIWENVASKKLYITGGVGASGSGEAYGDNYYLPNMSAYCETCAAIANVYWNHRLFMLHGDSKYIDVLERTLYNGLISGVSLTGDHFFYPNPLESQGQHSRQEWFGCACCPSNITRFLPSVPNYVYAIDKDKLFVNLFIQNSANIEMSSGKVDISQTTNYPWDGNIEISIDPENDMKFDLRIRIPGWAGNLPVPSDLYTFMNKNSEKIEISVNSRKVNFREEKGYAVLKRNWKKGDKVKLIIPMPVRKVIANENVKDDLGRLALQKGPIVFCLEDKDNIDGKVLNLLLDENSVIESSFNDDLLDGVQILTGKAFGLSRAEDDKIIKKEQNFIAIPYFSWANRGKSDMMVWIPYQEEYARPLAAQTIASTSTASASNNVANTKALSDQYDPKNSNDHSNMFLHWWPRFGTIEWVQYDFEKTQEISEVEVYWFDDEPRGGGCRIPKSWKILYKESNTWKEVTANDPYLTDKDKYIKVSFNPVKTSAIKLEIQVQEGVSTGIHEWKVK